MTFPLISWPSSYGFWVNKILLRTFELFNLIHLCLRSFSLQQQLRSLFIYRVDFTGRITKTHIWKLRFRLNFLFIHTKTETPREKIQFISIRSSLEEIFRFSFVSIRVLSCFTSPFVATLIFHQLTEIKANKNIFRRMLMSIKPLEMND